MRHIIFDTDDTDFTVPCELFTVGVPLVGTPKTDNTYHRASTRDAPTVDEKYSLTHQLLIFNVLILNF